MNRRRSRRALVASATGATALALALVGATAGPVQAAGTVPAPGGTAPAPVGSTPEPVPVEPDPDEEPGEEPDEEGGTEAVPEDPLEVVIDRLSPSVVPDRGTVQVTGSVRNRSTTDWTELAVYLLTSSEPMTSDEELAAGVASDPRTEVGTRIVEPGSFVEVPDLAPGESTRFRLSVPRNQLGISGEPGVYWLGVHVLGTTDVGRLEGADGRARTFLPLVPEQNDGTELALGLQLRNHTIRAADGTVSYPRRWQRSLADDGRLDRLLDLGESAGDWPLTWVVDPAVVEAAESISRGNPPLDLAPPEDGPPSEEPEDSEGSGEQAERAAGAWLEEFVDETGDGPVLAVPYGDVDASALFRYNAADLVETALATSVELLEQRSVFSSPVLLPADGWLSPSVVAGIDSAVPVVLGTQALPSAGTEPVLAREGGGRIVVSPTHASLWGPAPGAYRSALSVRQRLLAEAALHALSSDRDQPLVRFLPPRWNPGGSWRQAQFFEGLDVPWLSGTSVAALLDAVTTTPTVDPVEVVEYPDAQLELEVPARAVVATESLISGGVALEELLSENEVVDEVVARQALLSSSFWSRLHPGPATRRALNARALIMQWLSRVSVRGPSFVTMSSETGTFHVTLINGLDQPVTVGLRTTVIGEGLDLDTPDAIDLPPRGRASMQIDATSGDIGVHEVRLQPISEQGTTLGEELTMSIRSSQVGLILWIIMGVGGAVLFLAIAVRIWRRVRRRQRTHGPVLSQGDA